MFGLWRLRRRAMAREKKADTIGANTKLARRKMDSEIHVWRRKSIELQANPHPMTNQ